MNTLKKIHILIIHWLTHTNSLYIYIYIYIGWYKIWVLHPILIEFNLIIEMSNSCVGCGTNEK